MNDDKVNFASHIKMSEEIAKRILMLEADNTIQKDEKLKL